MTKRGSSRLLFAAAAATIVGSSFRQADGGTLYWDINGASPGASAGTTAAGTWDASTTNWSTSANGDVTTGAWVSGETAAFSAGTNATGVATTVTVVGNHTIGGLDFQEGQVNLSGAAPQNLTLTGTPTFNVSSPLTATIFVPISGSVRWTKTGTGVLSIPNAKANTGGVTINQGTVQIVGDTGLGAVPASPAAGAGYLVFDGGTLRHNNGSTSVTISANRGITVNAGGGTLGLTGTSTGSWIYNGAGLAGTGTLTKTGINLLALGGNNSGFTGKWVVTEGTIQSNNAANSGEAGFGDIPSSFIPDGITLNGGGLRVGPNNYTIHANRGITLGVNGGFLSPFNAGSSITINSVITGVGSLTKGEANLAILAGANTYTGDTTVNAGTLQVDGSLAHGNINIATAGTLNGSGTLNYNIVGDASDLTAIVGAGVLNITALDLVLNVTGTQTASEYVLVDKPASSTNVLGTAFASETLPAGWSIDYDGTVANPNAIVALVPEPTALGFLAFGGLLLARRRP